MISALLVVRRVAVPMCMFRSRLPSEVVRVVSSPLEIVMCENLVLRVSSLPWVLVTWCLVL